MVRNILDAIIARKHEEIDAARAVVPEETLAARAREPRVHRPFFASLAKPGPHGANIIAEVKRASPSKGIIREGLDPAAQALAYEAGGAAAMSVLTDRDFFRGSPEDLQAARAAVQLPVLRKDFTVSTYQIYEAAAMGADAILLIAGVLAVDFMKQALALCGDLGLDALVEVHSEPEWEKASEAGARLVGVNNRDLKTFKTDLETTVRLRKKFLPGQVAVGESGIRNRDDIKRLLDAGVFNFLIGESLVRAENPAAMLGRLLGAKP